MISCWHRLCSGFYGYVVSIMNRDIVKHLACGFNYFFEVVIGEPVSGIDYG